MSKNKKRASKRKVATNVYALTESHMNMEHSKVYYFNTANWILNNGKVNPGTGHKGPDGELRYSFTLSLTSALDGGWVVNATPGLCTPQKDIVPTV
jgi:hypothetical protein